MSSDFEKLKSLLESNKQTIKKQANIIKSKELNEKKFLKPIIEKQEKTIKNKDLNIKNLKKKLAESEVELRKKTAFAKAKLSAAVRAEKKKKRKNGGSSSSGSSGWGAYRNCMKKLAEDD